MTSDVREEIGEYILSKMKEREEYLREQGKIKKGQKFSRNFMSREVLGVSSTWFNAVVNGEKEPNDEMLIKLANFLDINEHEMFKVARRIHPEVLEEYRKEYLGDYYVPINKD